MGKNKSKDSKNKKSGRAKFVILGIIAVVVLAAIVGVANFGTQTTHLSVDTSKGSPILGSQSAPVTVIEFGDYQCPFCKKWNQDTKPLIEEDYINEGKVKLVYVDFAIIGPDSIKAHAGSYCADEQGLYWQYHDLIYANQGHENDGWANAGNIKSLASKLEGLNTDAFGQCLDSGKYENRVKENKNVALRSGASSTPSFIVIGPDGQSTQVTGAQPYSVFQALLDEKLAS